MVRVRVRVSADCEVGMSEFLKRSSQLQSMYTTQLSESRWTLGRDGADAQYMQLLKQKPYNFTTNTLKA